MDKNVGSVNLEELKAAREALDRERGVETDPNMYKNYDPDKHKAEREQERLMRDQQSGDGLEENEDASDEIISDNFDDVEKSEDEILIDDSEKDDSSDEILLEKSSDEESTSENFEIQEESKDESESINLNLYDTFSDFEVKGNDIASETPEVDNEEDHGDEVSNEDLDSESDVEEKNVESSLDDFLSELDSILSKNSGDDDSDEILEDSNDNIEDKNEETETETLRDLDAEIESKLEKFADIDLLSDSDEDEEEVEEISETKENDEPVTEVLERFSDIEQIEPLNNDFFEKNNEFEEKTTDSFDTEVLTDFSKISEMMNDIHEEELIEEESEVEEVVDDQQEEQVENAQPEEDEVEVGGYEKIEPFNFVDVMSSEEFKDIDNLSYLIGKNSEGKFVYGNLTDTCGTVIFTKNEESVKSNFNSMILSLILKNNPQSMQFVICDPMFDSEFDIYKKSSYMYFNRVAKNNREIVDSMFELSKELEKRYNELVYAGVKNISAYNMQASDRNVEPMPYIVLFINNYMKMMQFLDAEKINTCLYNILKFGRLVGVYAVVATTADIDKNEINYNLPTRICYRTEDEYDSVASIGSGGAEKLRDEQDFLYSTVFDDEVKHLKCATLSLQEIEVIIENLEN